MLFDVQYVFQSFSTQIERRKLKSHARHIPVVYSTAYLTVGLNSCRTNEQTPVLYKSTVGH